MLPGSPLKIWRSTILAEAACTALAPLSPFQPPGPPKWLQLLAPWGAALALSALLVWAGGQWPTPLLEQAWARRQPEAPFWLALALVLLPPLLMGLWLLRGLWLHPDRGESSD